MFHPFPNTCFAVVSCKNQYKEKNSIAGKKAKNEKRAIIIIQPLGDFPQSQTTIVSKELGHTQGLNHCPEKTCLMRDAEGKDHLNELKDFCPKCKSVLVKVGWQFKVMQ